MRSTGLTRRDAFATVFVAAAMTLYALTEAGVGVPGMDSVRMRASAVFLLGAFAFGAGAAADAFTARGIVEPIVPVLSLLGFATLIVGVVAIAAGSAAFLDGLAGGIALLWLGATLRHMTRPVVPNSPESLGSPAPRELVKR